MRSRIMCIERKIDGVQGPARIGRVTFSQSATKIYYRGQEFATLHGRGFKANYYCVETGDEYWISGCKTRVGDRLYAGSIAIDDDVAEEYWTKIRGQPEKRHQRVFRCIGKYTR